MAAATDGVSIEVEAPDIETFGSNQSRKIRVRNAPADSGFLARADVDAVLPASAGAAWEILTHEDNHKVFKNIKLWAQLFAACLLRSIVVEVSGMHMQRTSERKYIRNTKQLQEYDVSHYIGWQFLWRKGEFQTRLRVKQDKRKHTVSFHLLESDIMKKFEGMWTLYPYSQRSVDKIFGKSKGFNPIGSFTDMLASKREHRCIVQFEQNITPKGVPPKLRGLARRIAASAMQQTLSDIDDEAKRIQHGASQIPELNRFAYRPGAPAHLTHDKEGSTEGSQEARAEHGPQQGKRNKERHAEMATAPAGSLSAASYQRSAQAASKQKSRRQQDDASASFAPAQAAPGALQSSAPMGLWQASLGNCITV